MPNKSIGDAISIALNTILSHLDKRNTYVSMLFIDYSSAFNTTVPSKLITKLRTLGLNTSICNWILDFLTGSPQVPMLSPLLYFLFTHDCKTVIKFADDTTVVDLITFNDETVYREEVRDLVVCCQDNNLSLNMIKTKEMIVDYRKKEYQACPHSHRLGCSGTG
jgi:gmma-aminobutyric acid receptor subunit gamma/cGMP-dependent protein kinase 2